jgi:hypothetical protein
MKFLKKHWPWILIVLVIAYFLFKAKPKTTTATTAAQINSLAAAETAAFNGD